MPAKRRQSKKKSEPAPVPPAPVADVAPQILPPAPLTGRAMEKWIQLVADLRDRKSWSLKDRHALYILADSLACYEEMVERIAREGIIVLGRGGEGVKHPGATLQNQSWDRCSKLLAAFGLTPAGRKGIGETDEKDVDLDDLMGGDDDDDGAGA